MRHVFVVNPGGTFPDKILDARFTINSKNKIACTLHEHVHFHNNIVL